MHFRTTKSTIALLLFVMTTGCAGDKERLVLEERLRDKESTIRELQQKVAKAEQLLAEQDEELAAVRTPAEADSNLRGNSIRQVSATTETAVAWGSVDSISIHKLTSGVVGAENRKRVNVVIQPLDEDGELVKVAGQLKVTAAVVDASGEPEVVCVREINITESRQLWARSLISSGFHVELNASRELPADTNLLLTAILDLGRERVFSTTELIGPK